MIVAREGWLTECHEVYVTPSIAGMSPIASATH
jgi:hypothetical protein